MPVVNDPDVGLAIGLTSAAGAATAVGACVVFVPRLVRLASRRTLAAALALSAGVMIYVSFIEIMALSLGMFTSAGFNNRMAYIYATLSFFGGVVVMMILNFIVTALLGGKHHHHHHDDGHHHLDEMHEHDDGGCCRSGTRQCTQSSVQEDQKETEEVEVGCPCCAEDPVGELEKLQRMAEEMDHMDHPTTPVTTTGTAAVTAMEEEVSDKADSTTEEQKPNEDLESGGEHPNDGDSSVVGKQDVEELIQQSDSRRDEARQKEQQKLLRMSVNTAVAIALHNFPEGLVTFLSTLADPKVGAVLCVAIAIHNIPEGICVAMPIYYATGNRWKAFGWAVLSGLSEPLAALLGWAVLATLFSNTLYAVMFGIVAGMMVIISMRELLPTAHRYDPDDSVVTYVFIVGMVIIALSLVLFKV